MSPRFKNLEAPPAALEKGGDEVLRAVVVEPAAWGVALADITRHVARIFAIEHHIREQLTIDRIRRAFEVEMETPTDLGKTSAIS
jgi:hypothetical protein